MVLSDSAGILSTRPMGLVQHVWLVTVYPVHSVSH